MATKAQEIRNPDSCLNKAAFDEPVFVLRANDPVAAHVVEYWAACYAADKALHAAPGVVHHLTDKQQAKHTEALDLALRMRTYIHIRARNAHADTDPTAEESDHERAGVYTNGDPR